MADLAGKDRVIRIARKLASLNDQNATQEEAAIAAVKLAEILEKYNLTMATVSAAEVGESITRLDIQTEYAKLPAWLGNMSTVIAQCYDCRLIVGHWGDPKRKFGTYHKRTLIFIGSQVDAEVASYFCDCLQHKLWAQATKEARETGNGGSRMSSYRNSWIIAAVQAIRKRLSARRTWAAEEDENVTALVQIKGQEVQKFINQHFPDLSRGSAGTDSGLGTRDGRAAGSSMSLKDGIDGGPNRKRLE